MLDIAIQAVRAAGAIQLSHFSNPLQVDDRKHHDIKLEVDRLSEEKILSIVRTAFPDHGVLAEESGRSDRPSKYVWIIDPLDGTVNYAHRVPHFCSSVALWENGEPLVGAVYDAYRDELFAAERGKGATLNGKPIHVSTIERVEECFVACGFMKTQVTIQKGLERFVKLVPRAQKMRVMGASALDQCYVASGRFDVYVEYGIKPWDVGAGTLVIREAGGRVDLGEGPEGGYDVLATNGLLHKTIREILNESEKMGSRNT